VSEAIRTPSLYVMPRVDVPVTIGYLLLFGSMVERGEGG